MNRRSAAACLALFGFLLGYPTWSKVFDGGFWLEFSGLMLLLIGVGILFFDSRKRP